MDGHKALFTLVVSMVLVALSAATPAVASYSAVVLEDKPVAYWRFGETAGDTAYDSSGNGYNGSYYGPALGQTGAIAGDGDTSALFFASEHDTVQVNNSGGLIPGQDSWSVEAWIKTPLASYMDIVGWYPGGYYGGHCSEYGLYVTSAGLPGFSVRDQPLGAVAINAIGTTSIADASWHHVVGVLDRDGNRVRLYVDGVQVASAPVGLLGSISDWAGVPVSISGQHKYWTSDYNWFQGRIDEVAMYRGALSSQRVLTHYQAGLASGDADGDGIADYADKCPNTAPGVTVDANGCEATQCLTPDQLSLAVQSSVTEKDATIAALKVEVASEDLRISQLQQDIAALDATISQLNAAIAAKDQTIALLNAKVATMYTKEQLDQAVRDAVAATQQADMATLTASLGTAVGDVGLTLPGATVAEQITNLSNAIGGLPKGQIDKLQQLLNP